MRRANVVTMGDPASPPPPPCLSKRQRFLAGYTWLVLKNALGWLLVLSSFVAGPLVPGPGGIPLFLVGFALVSFPGKRRLTARVLRGRPFVFPRRPFVLISLLVALGLPALVLAVVRWRSIGPIEHNRRAAWALYVLGVAFAWLVVRRLPWALNLLLRLVARGRRRMRPWLRRHRIRLLPPRWRRRRAHEPGIGPLRLKDEILKFYKRGAGRD